MECIGDEAQYLKSYRWSRDEHGRTRSNHPPGLQGSPGNQFEKAGCIKCPYYGKVTFLERKIIAEDELNCPACGVINKNHYNHCIAQTRPGAGEHRNRQDLARKRAGLGERKDGEQNHIQLLPGDIGKTVFLPGDVSRAKVIADHFDSAKLVASNRQYNTYTGMYKGIKVSVPPPASAKQQRVRKDLIRIGTCGMMQTWLPSPGILVITGAVSGDSLTREYFP